MLRKGVFRALGGSSHLPLLEPGEEKEMFNRKKLDLTLIERDYSLM